MLEWKPIAEFVEPKGDSDKPTPVLFWRPGKGATHGFIRDGELFNAASIYVCDSNKVSHFIIVEGPTA